MTKELANLLFPNITMTPEDYLKLYPARNTPALRLAPSPTGYLHIGGLAMALACRMLADQMGGISYLRIEDTDQKREVKGATEKLVGDLSNFNIIFDEGFDGKKHIGKYAPYRQSERTAIYHSFAKLLIELGRAYPCFCTSEQLEKTREIQTKNKENPGYHGKYIICKKLSLDQVKKNLDKKIPWVLRFDPQSKEGDRIIWLDNIKGSSSLPAILNNPVIIKSNGVPPYNFAHVVDDLLMRTSHVLRGEEWLPSTAEHIQILDAFCFDEKDSLAWKYAHAPVICIEDSCKKRKLSKRKDKFAMAETFIELGYPKEAVIEYLLTLYNTDFEKWRIAYPDKPISEFNFRFEKIGKNSPMFDIQKLNYISREIIAKKTNAQISKDVGVYFGNKVSKTDLEKIKKVLSIDRETPKPRKDLEKYSDILTEYDYLFTKPKVSLSRKEQIILDSYKKTYDKNHTREQWFENIKSLCELLGYASNMKDYKQSPEKYKGNIADVTQAIRKAVTGRENTPDLYQILQILWEK